MPSIKLHSGFVRDQMQMVPQQFDPEVVEEIQNQSYLFYIFTTKKD